MASWKPAYLIHGDDHGRIGERRASLRARAEAESGVGGLEILEGDAATPENVGLALSAMTFAIGRRFVVVDGVERWKQADVDAHVVPALAGLPPDTTVAFFAREDGRAKIPASLSKAVKKAGGDVVEQATVKARELPKWALGEAQRLGLDMDVSAAQALVAQVGERQQRILRELEKLALEHGPGTKLTAEDITDAAADSAEIQVWGLVDALVARDRRTVFKAFLELREQGEAVGRLIPLMARRLREVLAIADRLEAGESPAQVKSSTKGSPWALDRRIKEARTTDPDALRRAIETLADLELQTRGIGELSDDTAAIRALGRMAAAG
ncbi:MAG TPA: DNA polymerase III subunit delta [Baekduia sp.]|uniref:DNA polymerase III subunit delta n=1 Tax=Baekduia sp. TaxID=2600305 RepID=UPI002D77923B|nr:DNA polymerase III subunit delta [Baekduia sp.]HET6509186.1 DNA polymerase III subunit delta [Baekduia sp.]